MTLDEILDAIIAQNAAHAAELARLGTIARYTEMRPALLDIVSGLSTAQTAKKHNIPLTTFQRQMRELQIAPVTNKQTLNKLAKKIENIPNNATKAGKIEKMRQCNCETCQFVLFKIDRMQRGYY